MNQKLVSSSLLIVRLVLGAIFVYHGWPKLLSSPELLGLPGFVGFFVGIVEVVFGLLIMLGVGFPWAVYTLMGVIAVALAFVQVPGGFSRGVGAGLERDMLILAVLILLSVLGPGRYSLGRKK